MKRYLPIIITLGVIFLVLIVLTYWQPRKKDILDSSIWRVESLNMMPLEAYSTLTIRFHNQKFSASSECNRFKGRYEISGDEIVIELLERTSENCMEPEIMQQDEEFISILQSAERLSFLDNDLKFYSNERQELLDFLLIGN